MVSSHLLRTTSLTLANILIPVAVLVFAAGFFPYKPVLPGLADWRDGADAGEWLWDTCAIQQGRFHGG
jgi:hypothetical protein